MNLYQYYNQPTQLDGNENIDTMLPQFFYKLYKYDPQELKKRETGIAKSPEFSFKYARFILKGRFPEGEDAIATSPKFSFKYARAVLKRKRFPLGEPAIATSAEYSVDYAVEILDGVDGNERFELGEPAIAKDAYHALWYVKSVIKDRWEMGEPAIFNSEHKHAYLYHLESIGVDTQFAK